MFGNKAERLLIGCFVIIDVAALEGIAPAPVLKSARVFTDVFECLAERKMDAQHLAGRQTILIGGKCFKIGKIRITRAKCFQIRPTEMCFSEVRLESECFGEFGRRFFQIALLFENVGQIIV